MSTTMNLTGGPAEADTVFAGALDGLLIRAGVEVKDREGRPRQPNPHARQFARMRLADIAAASVRARGLPVDQMDPDDIATQFLASAGMVQTPFTAASYNTPGQLPNLLSALAGKMMDLPMDDAAATYTEWASPMPSVPDFKPKTIHRLGAFGELPRVPDGDDFPQSKNDEEVSWIQTDVFGESFHVTPKMIADDDLEGIIDSAKDLQTAHDLTLNRLCVDILTSNPDLPDGVAFFHATHANLGSAGAVSVTTLDEARKLMRLQTHVGGRRRVRIGPALILIPAEIETVTEQVLAPLTVVPVTDATTNPFRNKMRIVTEPMLSDASATAWYVFAARNRIRSIVYMFQSGFELGKRTQRFDPRNNCLVITMEGRFGAAAGNFRGAVKNPGA